MASAASDDEYRMLRQDVFEKYSSSTAIPVETPVVPVTRVHVQLRSSGESYTPKLAPSGLALTTFTSRVILIFIVVTKDSHKVAP